MFTSPSYLCVCLLSKMSVWTRIDKHATIKAASLNITPPSRPIAIKRITGSTLQREIILLLVHTFFERSFLLRIRHELVVDQEQTRTRTRLRFFQKKFSKSVVFCDRYRASFKRLDDDDDGDDDDNDDDRLIKTFICSLLCSEKSLQQGHFQ